MICIIFRASSWFIILAVDSCSFSSDDVEVVSEHLNRFVVSKKNSLLAVGASLFSFESNVRPKVEMMYILSSLPLCSFALFSFSLYVLLVTFLDSFIFSLSIFSVFSCLTLSFSFDFSLDS